MLKYLIFVVRGDIDLKAQLSYLISLDIILSDKNQRINERKILVETTAHI